MRLIVDEVRPLPAASFNLPFPKDVRARKAARGILKDLSVSRSVTELAHQVGVSSRTLARLFSEDLGISVARWQQEARLQASLPWLAQGRGILEIATDLGYTSPSAFSAAFRKYFGIAPSTYFHDSAL